MDIQKSVSVLRIKLDAKTMAKETQINLGTKVRVCSCKLVMDCTKLTKRPTTVAVPKIGIARSNPVWRRFLIKSTASSIVIIIPSLCNIEAIYNRLRY